MLTQWILSNSTSPLYLSVIILKRELCWKLNKVFMKGCVSDTKYLFNKRFISLSGNCYYISGAIGMFLFSCSVMSDSLQPHELQHARLPCYRYNPYLWYWKLSLCAPMLNWHSKKEIWVEWKRIVSLFSWAKGDTEGSVQFRSVAQWCPTLWSHGLQHARFPCPWWTPRACSNSCPLSGWCHPIISSSVVPFSSFLWSFPASGSFPVRLLFTSGGQSIGVSASASVLPMNIQDWFPLGLTDLIFCSPKDSPQSSPAPQFKKIN